MNGPIDKNRKYSEEHIQRVDVNAPINPFIEEILFKDKVRVVADFGCGEGVTVIPIDKKFPDKKIIGLDISPRRIDGVKKVLPKHKFFVSDVSKTNLKSKSVDFIISTQVIEHVPDDKIMASEMGRVLRNKGYLFVSSVIKKPFALYKYRNNGCFVLDPTHEREYLNKEQFFDIFKKDFKLIKWNVVPVKRSLFGLNIKIPGFYLAEGLWQKRR